jgi:hypothetical protein
MKRSRPRSVRVLCVIRSILLFAFFHRGFGRLVVHAGGAALGDLGDRGFGDDLLHGRRVGGHRAGAGDVAHGAEAHHLRFDGFAFARRGQIGQRHQQAVARNHLALVREVDRRQFQLFAGDVLPHVQLGPVRDREHAHVLARMDAGVIQVPQFRALRLRVPLAEFVAEREDALLGAGLFFVAAGAADAGVEAVFGDGFQQRHGLCGIARIGLRIAQAHGAALDRVFDRADDQAFAQFGHALVAEGDDFREVVAGVDVHQREGEFAGTEGLFGDAQQDDRVLAAREQQGRVAAFGRDFAHDVDGFRFQPSRWRDVRVVFY